MIKVGQIRLSNALSRHYLQNTTKTGGTPEPCTGFMVIAPASEAHPQDGTTGYAPALAPLVYQLNEGRVGPDGQAVNQFLNGVPGSYWANATPYVWSVIQFDANGQTQPLQSGNTSSNIQIFNTFQVYTGTFGLPSIPQAPLETFIALDATSFYRIPQ
jgi:hypothetical protein